MGYLLHIALALAAQGVAEAGVTTGVCLAPAVALGLLVPHVLAAIARRAFLRGHFRSGELALRVLGASAPWLYFAALSLCGWADCVERWVGHELSFLAWPKPALFLVLLPFVLYELAAIDARARVAAPIAAFADRRAIRGWRSFQIRMFLSSILPIAVYLLISSAVGWDDDVRIQVEEVALYNGLFAAGLLLLLVLFLPSLLRTTWETVPLADGLQRDVLLEVAARARFRSRALLVWKTGHSMANAAIVGIGARNRVVLFSDSLLAQLDLRELAAVFAHEIGHALRHHVPIFGLWIAAFFLGADLLATSIFPDDPWLAGGLVLAVMGVWYLSFGFLSRRFELDADLYSLDLLGDHRALISALERVGGRLRDVASWRHFSTADRVRFLERASLDRSIGTRLRRGLRRWTIAGSVVFAALLAIQVWSLAASFSENQVRADLRRGYYARAVARALALEGIDSRLGSLVARAGCVGANVGERVDGEALEALARAALRAGDADAALEWLELGSLRGRTDLEAVAAELRRRLDSAAAADSVEEERTLPLELEGAWNRELGTVPQ